MRRILLILTVITCILGARGEYTIDGKATLTAGVGSNDFAPFYLHSNRHGKLTQSKSAQLDIGLSDPLDIPRRFDWSWGVEFLTGWQSSASYWHWNPEGQFSYNSQHPARIWLQQLYAEVKWRCLFLSVGMKDRGSSLVDEELSSGDLVWSGNTRSIPEVRIGFVDFQNIPFTKKWLQVDMCLSYGKFTDSKFIRSHYSYERGKINPGTLWTYKRLYFRTNPEAPFHAKFGFQMTGLFGGKCFYYNHGRLEKEVYDYEGFRDFVAMLFPFGMGREGFKTGDHKGSWDISLTYRFRNSSRLRAYTQFFWDDGTGMSKSNGFDGLWGLEYKLPGKKALSGVVAEYLDFTNQAGPLMWPGNNDSDLKYEVLGADNYYNNFYHRSYVNYGQTIGTPMVMGTVFQLNGRSELLYNRVRAIHVAAEGYILPELQWRAKYSHRKAWGGSSSYELLHPIEADSWLAGVKWDLPQVPGLSVSADIAADHGTMPGNAFCVLLGASWDCSLTFGKKKFLMKSL